MKKIIVEILMNLIPVHLKATSLMMKDYQTLNYNQKMHIIYLWTIINLNLEYTHKETYLQICYLLLTYLREVKVSIILLTRISTKIIIKLKKKYSWWNKIKKWYQKEFTMFPKCKLPIHSIKIYLLWKGEQILFLQVEM